MLGQKISQQLLVKIEIIVNLRENVAPGEANSHFNIFRINDLYTMQLYQGVAASQIYRTLKEPFQRELCSFRN